jgi:hypothetical protein
MIALTLIHAVAFTARLIGGTARQISVMLVSLYDLFIMLPLGIERLVANTIKSRQKPEFDEESVELYMEEK